MSGTSRAVIDGFLALRRIAFIGVSRQPKDFSRLLFRDLRQRGYELVPVHPEAVEIEGLRAARSLDEIAPVPDAALVMTPPGASAGIVEQCARLGIGWIWLYRAVGPGSVTPEAVEACHRHRIQVVAGECPLMFLPKTGWIHSLHRGIRTLTGSMPH